MDQTTLAEMAHTWVVIMAGGTGSRFWPVSGADCPKQFIDVMGTGKSMLQGSFERFEGLCPRDHIVIVTGEGHIGQVHEQVPGLAPHQVLGEPLRRNTAPCIAYAAAVIGSIDPEATIIVSPSDHAIFHQARFEADMRQAIATVASHDWIVTFGAQPVRPDTSYGYIQFREQPSLPATANLHQVVTFTEKPPVELARQFIASGEFFWNTGLLVWRLPTLRAAYRQHLPAIEESFFAFDAHTPAAEVEHVYSQCETISIDNGIMEKADNVHVLSASFGWSDVETWDSLYGVSPRDGAGNAIVGGNVFTYNTRNCMVSVPDGLTVVIDGLEDYIVAAGGNDTLMICPREREEMVFRFASDVELKRLIDKK